MYDEKAFRELQAALMASAAPVPTPDGGVAVVLPTGFSLNKIPPFEQPLPSTIRQAVTMHDAPSFIAYVNRFKMASTRLFAEPGFLAEGRTARITAVLDYHGEGNAPNRTGHVVSYAPRYSGQWATWHARHDKAMAQVDFAEFIEEQRADIVQPIAAELLDIVRTFKASKRVEFDSVVYQPNGDVRLAYDERTTQAQGQSGVLPEMMMAGIPVYFRGDIYAVPVFVRYRLGNGKVSFVLKMDRSDIIEDEAFTKLAASIAEQTGIEAYLGRRG